MKTVVLTALAISLAQIATAQERREINFPDLPGYHTLVCDLHTHTVFSDGVVWPTVRIDEAWRLGLDAIAITDHIEYQPHQEDIPTNHNRPFELVKEYIERKGLEILLPRGAEITRDTPPGHFNGIFLEDVDPLETDDFTEVVQRATEQGGFVFWNHQEWKGPEKGRWRDVHTTIFENGWLHGMEVANGTNYYHDAHQWCLDRGLTMLGTSDIHHPDLDEISTPETHRTLTLVFAKERTLDGLRNALRAGYTAVWFKDQLIGREEVLGRLMKQCVQAAPIHDADGTTVAMRVVNDSDIPIQLARLGDVGPEQIRIKPNSLIRIPLEIEGVGAELRYEATNLLVAPGQGLVATEWVPARAGW